MTYSVADYCYSMLEKTDDAKLRTLLVDLLNYGAASQDYTGYKHINTCNKALTEEQKAWGTATVPSVSSVLNTKVAVVEGATAKWKGAGLVLDNAVTVRLRFAAESTEGLSVKITAAGQEWTITEFESAGIEGEYYVRFSGLTARQMRETLNATIYCDGAAISNTVAYSIESYAAAKQNDANAKLVTLLVAMMRYGDSAAAFLN